MQYLLTIIWIIIISVLSLLPGNNFKKVEVFDFFDKIVHFGFYFILSVIVVFDYNRKNKVGFFKARQIANLSFVVLLISLLLGAIIEILQFCCIPNRTGTIGDFIADSLGAAVGMTTILFFFLKIKRPTF